MQRWALGIGTIALGGLLLSMAVPRMVAHSLMLPGNTALDLIAKGELVSREGYDRILRGRDAALEWLDLPSARIDLGVTLYLMAQNADRLEIDPALALPEARRQLELGLAGAPVDARAWLWLADINQFLGDLDRAAKAVRLALLSAPHDITLATARAGLAFRVWDDLAPDAKAIAAHDARTALGAPDAVDFVQQIVETERLEQLRDAIANDSVSMARLSELLMQQGIG